ncbi:BTB/POZ domain-containing protein At3g56230 [Euphorbia lathyris]|uniref:BTB/POZ domain-containing protein At3g56230 n=1 Tax=Euphorbia lathyris TaxID=212925 RepID=UPI00331386EC
MDCSICSSMPTILRPPRNTICGSCFEGAKTVISLVKELETDRGNEVINLVSLPNSSNKGQPLENVPKWINNMKETEEELNEKIKFLSGFISLFREQILTDIQLKPGNGGPSISTHKAILAARSEIFKTMLDSDSCKAPANDTITIPELNNEELESLLEFLYTGILPLEKLEKHVYSLTIAADKYEIPFLLKFCDRHLNRSLNSSNALDVLEISDVCSNKVLKENALNFIVKNLEDIVFSTKYETFVTKNPHLAVHVTRAFLMDVKSRRRNENYIV